MARIELRIGDPANRIVLKTMLEAHGHVVVTETPEVVFCDDLLDAGALNGPAPVVVLVQSRQIPEAVRAMRQGVYGYIVLPFQPDEASMMIQRALAIGMPRENTPFRSLRDVERDHIYAVLRACKNNCSEAARVLGIGRNTLWRKLRHYESARSSTKDTP